MNNQEIAFLLFLLIFDVLITASRAGLLNIRRARILSLQEQMDERINSTIELVSRRSHLRSSLKLTQSILRILMAGLLLSAVGTWQSNLDSPLSLFTVLIAAAVIIWFLEYLVERRVLSNPEAWAIRLTPLAKLNATILSPLLAIPSWLSRSPASETGVLVSITEEELKTLVDASQQAGMIESDESQMIHSIFNFGDTVAREIMVPRIDMLTLEVGTPLEDAADVVLASGFSRIPVYEDRIDKIQGILYTKDMLKVWRDGQPSDSLRSLLRPANFIPEAKKVDELLSEMQADRTHIAIVVDEYGGVAGLVTLEDIVEEIFGEIQDEYDEGEELPYQEIGSGEYLFMGRIELDEFNEIMHSELQSNGADTLGGLLYSRFGRVPDIGEEIVEGNLRLTVEKVARHRVLKVRAKVDKLSDNNSSSQQD
ncbi:MAG: hemolysin family protein [Anaerolineae bacterium]|nr:hemolysin family protein [Anaerolineae bacterium]